MKFQIPSSALSRIVGGVALLLLQFVPSAFAANNWERGKVLYAANCASCHFIPTNKPNFTAAQISGAIGGGVSQMSTLTFLTADQITDIEAYLGKTTFPVAELSPTTSDFGSISMGLTANRSFQLKNKGDAPLNVSSVSLSDTTNYAVTSDNCSGASVSTGGGTCTVQITFSPQSVASFNGRKLTINHNAIGDGASGTATPPRFTSNATLSGTGLAPFTVAPVSPLNFTPATAPAGTHTVIISDNKGDRIRVCRDAADSFSAPADFSLDSPASFDAGGCYIIATGAVPRSPISLVVRFVPSAPGPRFAKLTFQRLDGAGNATLPVTTLQLRGNPGGVATVNASSLFDAAGDPGVEVDGDNTLTRSVTLFSEGSAPLPFTSSTFTISGPSSSEYTVADTGCKALVQLPAFTSNPAPSCVLTVIFNPSDVGRRGPANLTIQIAGIADNVVTLNGLGFRGPRLAVRRGMAPLTSGDTVQFGAQTIGGIYPSIPVTLINGGTQGNLDVILPAAGSMPSFSFIGPAECRQLAPATECAVALHFDPAAAQAYATPFVIQTRPAGTSDPVKVFQLDLRGQGSVSAIPVLSWTDSSGTPIAQLAFADTAAGTPVTTNVRLNNAGPGGARLQFGNAIGLDSVNFALDTSNCGSGRELFEGTSCAVAVTFAPNTAGQKSASAQYLAEAGTPPILVVSPYLAITGTSRASALPALLQPSASTLQFTSTVIGSSAAPAELRLTNTGSRPLNVLSFTVSAPFSVQAKTCAAVPFVLPPGGECTVSITFQPTAEGLNSGTLEFNSDASTPVTAVALSGHAEPRANVSGGGCSISDGRSPADPTLWALVLLAAAVLFYRRRMRDSASHDGQPCRNFQ